MQQSFQFQNLYSLILKKPSFYFKEQLPNRAFEHQEEFSGLKMRKIVFDLINGNIKILHFSFNYDYLTDDPVLHDLSEAGPVLLQHVGGLQVVARIALMQGQAQHLISDQQRVWYDIQIYNTVHSRLSQLCKKVIYKTCTQK